MLRQEIPLYKSRHFRSPLYLNHFHIEIYIFQRKLGTYETKAKYFKLKENVFQIFQIKIDT